MKIIPHEDHVIVRLNKPKTESAGGIVLPDDAVVRKTGRVVAVSTGRWECGEFIAQTLKPGDIVLIGYCREEIEVDGETLHYCHSGDIIAKLEE